MGSSLTVGGAPHTIITGHSGMASQKMFTDLEQLWEGNIFYQYVLDETLAFEVREIHKVLPHDTTYLEIETGEDLCALVTCTPTGVNTHRLLVRGHRVKYVETKVQEQREVSKPKTDTRLVIAGAAVGAVVLFIIIFAVRRRRKHRNQQR